MTRGDRWWDAALLLAVLAAFATAFAAGSVLDAPTMLQDPRLSEWSAANLWAILTDDLGGEARQSGGFRPLTTLSYAVNHALLGNGEAPLGYVVVDVLLHVANVLLLASVLRALALPRIAWFGTALLWAVHPIGCEAVTNLAGRADLIAALGVLWGVRLHLGAAAPGAWRRVGMAAAMLVALGGKESGVALLGLLLACDLTVRAGPAAVAEPAGARWRRRLRDTYGPCLLVAVAWAAVRALAIDPPGPPPVLDNPLLELGPLDRLLGACAVLLDYLRLVLWPLRLSADWSYGCWPLDAAWFRWLGAGAAAAWLLALTVLWRARARAPVAALLGLWWFVALAPVANVFVPVGTIFGERLAYLPAIGPLALLALLASRRPRVGTPLLALMAALLCARTAARNLDWRSNLTIWSAAVATAPDSFKANSSYAVARYEQALQDGTVTAALDEVLGHAERAVAIAAPLPPIHQPADALSNLAAFYRAKAQHVPAAEAAAWQERAKAQYEDALRHEAAVRTQAPAGAQVVGSWRLHLGYAQFLRETGDRRGALAAFEEAVQLAPGPETLLPLAQLLRESVRPRDGALAAARLMLLTPGDLRAWSELQRCFAEWRPGAVAVQQRPDGSPALNQRQPGLRELLTEAARLQYDAALRLGQAAFAASFRDSVRRTFGVEIDGG
ncbi:MAG: hypothetical protein AB7O97_17045 [Planctomycetota bacterium]